MDGDGCKDSSEDDDDDNDGMDDNVDQCPHGDTYWAAGGSGGSPPDHDADGCRDATEDTDDDNDWVPDSIDLCPRGIHSWPQDLTPLGYSDYDSDGCLDQFHTPSGYEEDLDDDNDGVNDTYTLQTLDSNGNSEPLDTDGDGVGDNADTDDDNDGILDATDFANECGSDQNNQIKSKDSERYHLMTTMTELIDEGFNDDAEMG